MTPVVSVVMSVYNGAAYLREAIDSILAQTFKDFELILINDGSTDDSQQIIDSYHDPRLKPISQKNQGLVNSLNTGIQQAKGTYIARHDADDASDPERFAKQLSFLQQYPEVVIIGTSIAVMNETSKIKHNHAVLLWNSELKNELLIRSPFAHGSVMFRREAALKAGAYNAAYWPAEDYEFWLRLAQLGDFANIDEYLYRYRENEQGISATNQTKQEAKVARVQAAAWELRRELLPTRRIRLRDYQDHDMADMRIQRIVCNIHAVARKANQTGDRAYALKTVRLVASSPLLYKKYAGYLKRKSGM